MTFQARTALPAALLTTKLLQIIATEISQSAAPPALAGLHGWDRLLLVRGLTIAPGQRHRQQRDDCNQDKTFHV